MDQYHGVYVKVLLGDNSTVKGRIFGKDNEGNLLLRNAITENSTIGYQKQDDMLPIITSMIKDLQVLDMKADDNNSALKQQMEHEEVERVKQEEFYRQQQLQYQQQYYNMQSQYPPFHYQQQNNNIKQVDPALLFQQQSIYPTATVPTNHQQEHAIRMDPAMLFSNNNNTQPLKSIDPPMLVQQKQQQQNAPFQDPAIINQSSSSYQDPAIIRQSSGFQNPITTTFQDPAILMQTASLEGTDSINQSSSLRDPTFTQQAAITKQSPFKDPAIITKQSMSSHDPAILGQSHTSKKSAFKNPADITKQLKKSEDVAIFQDPAIMRQFNTLKDLVTVDKSLSPQKPLFGGQKAKKQVKQIVVYEDYNEFESGKSGNVKKVLTNKKVEQSSTKQRVNSIVPASLIPPKAQSAPTATTRKIQKSSKIYTVSGGIQIPTISSSQMENIKLIAKQESGFTQTQLIENSAICVSMMILKAVGGANRLKPNNHNAAPVVVLLCGNTFIGEIGIASARHLSNRGCQVILSTVDDEVDNKKREQYKSLAKYSGSKLISQIQDLPNQFTQPVDIIIDCLLGFDYSKLSNQIKSLIDWANTNKAPILSIDFPSGRNPDTGNQLNSFIIPKWTLALGIPYTGCISRSITGELFLADSGLPFTLYQSILSSFIQIPWGSDFILALEYSS